MKKIQIFSDGGSRGNPGPGAIGFAIFENSEVIYKHGATISVCTNNQAEYQAVLDALLYVGKNIPDAQIEFFIDSELVVKQLNGEYKVKNQKLKPLFLKIRESVIELGGSVTFAHVRREKNKLADSLVNKALDEA